MNNELRIIVAGSRDFNNFNLLSMNLTRPTEHILCRAINNVSKSITTNELIIIIKDYCSLP